MAPEKVCVVGIVSRHSFFPFYEGISRPEYTEAELEELNAPKYEYNGQKLTEYEATQRQRYIERQIRRWKREKAAMQAAGLDASQAAAKLTQWRERMRDFQDQTGLKRRYDRERVTDRPQQSHEPPPPPPAPEPEPPAPPPAPVAPPVEEPPKPLEAQDVTQEYLQQATPGEGAVEYEAEYKEGPHRDEIEVAT